MRVLRAAWGMPIGLPATAWMAAIGAVALQAETKLILKKPARGAGPIVRGGICFPSFPPGRLPPVTCARAGARISVNRSQRQAGFRAQPEKRFAYGRP